MTQCLDLTAATRSNPSQPARRILRRLYILQGPLGQNKSTLVSFKP